MTRTHQRIIDSWRTVVQNAIDEHCADAAYRLTIGLVRRCRELGLWNDFEEKRS
jgi:hypothetical protein